MQACRDGGAAIESASRQLDAEVANALHRECRMVLRDEHDARDVMQETFLRVWRHCASFRGDSELLAWVRGIMRRAIVDHFRAIRPEEALEDDDGELSPAAAEQVARLSMESGDRPDAWLSAKQRERCYREGFARFEAAFPLHAAVMRWVVEDGLTNEQIAALLRRTPGATREFVSQCRKKARLHLDEWYRLL